MSKEVGGLASSAVTLEQFARERALELTRFAYLITGDRGRGEDMVQEALFGMHRRFGDVLELADPLAYARRSIINAHASGLRRRRVVEMLSDSPPDLSPADLALPDDSDDLLWAALYELPPRQRTVLVARYYLGHNDRDIAVMLGCRVSSVRSLAARAFKTLRPLLRPANAVLGATR
jgi:RNA polymerase sigma-70 factor (sigma-E family)